MARLIDDHVAVATVERAVHALITHIRKSESEQNETELLGAKEDYVWLVLATKRMSPEKRLKPHRMFVTLSIAFHLQHSLIPYAPSPLIHPLIDPRTNSVCLISKDPQRQYKDLLDAKGVIFISRVVGVDKLKGKFKPFEARRQLLNEHALFLADDRVVPLLPNLLGKMFFEAKK
jgi:ribosome biogenesis protein UTP30